MLAVITFYSFVLFVHIAAVVLAFGVTFSFPIVMSVARKGYERHMGFFHRMQAVIGSRLIGPLGGLVLLAGQKTGHDGGDADDDQVREAAHDDGRGDATAEAGLRASPGPEEVTGFRGVVTRPSARYPQKPGHTAGRGPHGSRPAAPGHSQRTADWRATRSA